MINNISRKAIFTGDTCFVGCLENKSFEIEYPNKNFDFLITNIEQSIYSSSIKNKSTVLSSENSLIRGIGNLKPTHIGLANNHIHDGGLDNIGYIKRIIETSGSKVFGAGSNKDEAEQPTLLSNNIWILGCCAFNKPTLNNIALATDSKPGLMAGDYKSISLQLNKHKEKDFIIFIHWGVEHVPIPHPYTRNLAKKILYHQNVKAIIGMHPHIILPSERFYNKPVYYSLGNFLFPNFVIEPPTQLSKKREYFKETYSYHKVNELTLKKWRLKNRISLICEFDTHNHSFKESFMIQSFSSSSVKPLKGIYYLLFFIKYHFKKLILKLVPNNNFYKSIYFLVSNTVKFTRWSYIAIKLFNQFGYKHVWNILKRILN